MRDSLIVSLVMKIFSTLCVWYSNSMLCRVLDQIYTWVSKTVLGCAAGRFFTEKPRDGHYFRYSFVYKMLKGLCNIVRKPVKTFDKLRCELTGNSKVHDICENLLNISTSTYGVMLFFAGVATVISELIMAGTVLCIKGYAAIALMVFGIILFIINRTPANLGQGSKIIRFLRAFFVDDGNDVDSDSKLYLQDEEHKIKYTLVASLFGVCIGVIFALYSISQFVMVMGALLGTVFVFKFPTAGLFIFVAGSPFLPTMIQVGIVWLCLLSVIIKFMSNSRFKLKTGGFDVFVLMFMAVIVYGIIASFDFVGSLKMGLVYLTFTGAYFIITNLVNTSRKWKIFTVGFVLAAVPVALLGIAQNFLGVTSTASWVDSDMFSDIGVRVYSTFDNPNVLGEYLILAITIALGFIWSEKWVRKPWYTLAFIAFVMCIVFTWSRGAWLGLVGSLFLFAVIKDKRLAVLIILALICVPILGSEVIMSRIGSIGNVEDSSTAYRVSIWISSARIIKQFWVGGIGLGPDVFASIYGDYARSGASFALHAHNVFLQIIISFGVMGAVVFLLMMIYYIKQVYSHLASADAKTNSKVINAVLLAMSCAILGYYAQGLTDNVWYNYKMYGISWIIMALTIAGIRAADKEK